MNGGLQRLLRPKTIAVIGGGGWCENVISQSRAFGFQGDIWPVHPKHPTISRHPAFKSIDALPNAPDACFIGVNRHATIEVVQALAKCGAGGAVCFASGFSEAKAEDNAAADLQDQLLLAAGDMAILGPNCYGYINALDGALLWPDQHGAIKTQSGVAIITQSSNIAINLSMQRRGLPIAYLVTAGNQAQTGLAEIGMALLTDDRVTSIGLHIEGMGDIAALSNLSAKAKAVGKSIIALKVGQSAQARAATISHTASLAGSSVGASAVLKRLGIAEVATLSEFVESLKLLHVAGPLKSDLIASMSCSGGEASLMADLAKPCGVRFPELTQSQNIALRQALGPMVNLANPLDYHTYIWNDSAAMADAFTAMMGADYGLGILVSDFPRSDRCDAKDWQCVTRSILQTKDRTDVPMAIASSLPENMPEDVADDLIAGGITPLCGLNEALVAARVAAQCGQELAKNDPVLPPLAPIHTVTLSEAQAKTALAKYGVRVPAAKSVAGLEALRGAVEGMKFPLVLKGQGIAHKTEAGAVVLELKDIKQVLAAASNMPTDHYLLEEMVRDTVCELLIGVVLDPAHGYVLTIAAGGVLTELLSDSVSLLIPSTAAQIESEMQNLKIFALINGYRGQPAADLDAIIDAIMAIQDYVINQHGLIDEVEVNPLMCLPNAAIAADALISIGEKNDR